MRRLIVIAALVSVAGCVSAPPPQPPAPPPKPVPPPPPAPAPLSANWEDWPATPGDWVIKQDEKGSVALFGMPGTDAQFLIRCISATKRIYLSRAGSLPEGASANMTIRASDAMKAYRVVSNGDATPYVSAETSATDSQLDAIAFSRGRFLVSIPGARDLVIPSWPEFSRVIEDCRA